MPDLDSEIAAHQEEERRKKTRWEQSKQGARILKKAGKRALKGQIKKQAIKLGLRALLGPALPWIGAILGGMAVIFVFVMFVILVMTSFCGSTTGWVASAVAPGDFCEYFEGFQGITNSITTARVRQPPRIVDVSQWMGAIGAAASANNLDKCYLRSFVEKESSGDPEAIGHDHTAPPPPFKRWQRASDGMKAYEPNHAHDPFVRGSPPQHGLDWNFSHGIGLMQITIFPYNADWADAATPARVMPPGSGRKYTPQQLLDPNLSIDLAAQYLNDLVRRYNGDYQRAAAAYNGSGPQADQYAEDIIARASVCTRG